MNDIWVVWPTATLNSDAADWCYQQMVIWLAIYFAVSTVESTASGYNSNSNASSVKLNCNRVFWTLSNENPNDTKNCWKISVSYLQSLTIYLHSICYTYIINLKLYLYNDIFTAPAPSALEVGCLWTQALIMNCCKLP